MKTDCAIHARHLFRSTGCDAIYVRKECTSEFRTISNWPAIEKYQYLEDIFIREIKYWHKTVVLFYFEFFITDYCDTRAEGTWLVSSHVARNGPVAGDMP
jgi:hypothetical protein